MKHVGFAILGLALVLLGTSAAFAQDRGTGGGRDQSATVWHGPHFEISLGNRARPLRDWSFNRAPDDPHPGERLPDLVVTNNARSQPYHVIIWSGELDQRDAAWLQGAHYDSDYHAEKVEEHIRGESSEWRSVRQIRKQRQGAGRLGVGREQGTLLVLHCEPASGGAEVEMRYHCFQSSRNQRVYTVRVDVPKPANERDQDPQLAAILASFISYRPPR